MAKRKNARKNKLDKLFVRMLTNKTLRTDVVRRDFEWFFPIYFHERLEYPTAPFQTEIIKLLRDCTKKFVIITAFRGSAKTTLTSVAYVLWSVFGSLQKKHVLIVGQTEEKARRYLANIRRQLETNTLLRGDLGPIDEEKDQWGAKAFIIRKLNAKVVAVSVGQSVRGILHDEHRPDLVVCDDLESLESVQTQESRDKLFDWFQGELLPVGGRHTRFIVIGNLLHEDSLMRRLQRDIENDERDGEFREYTFFEEDGVTPRWLGKYPTVESVEEEKRLIKDPVAWSREYLLKILPRDEQVIPKEWIRYSDELPDEAFYYHATGIDLAISKSEKADFTAMVSARVCGRRNELKIYILPNVVNKRLTFLETIEQAKLISDGLGKSELFIEEVQYQSAAVEMLKKEGYPAKGVRVHGQDKYARLSAVSHLVQAGKVFFPREGATALINQLTGFGSEKHDDLVDAFSILLSKIIEKDNRPRALAISFKGEYRGEYDHLPPREREAMLRTRENMRKAFLL